jgi:hypothetical protein
VVKAGGKRIENGNEDGFDVGGLRGRDRGLQAAENVDPRRGAKDRVLADEIKEGMMGIGDGAKVAVGMEGVEGNARLGNARDESAAVHVPGHADMSSKSAAKVSPELSFEVSRVHCVQFAKFILSELELYFSEGTRLGTHQFEMAAPCLSVLGLKVQMAQARNYLRNVVKV